MERVYKESEIYDVAQWLWMRINDHMVIALHGPMGVGKTTLVHAICRHLNIKDTVSSPTFSIINEYEFKEAGITRFMYHIDLYRLQNEEEAIRAGIEDCIYSNNYCLIEWPERAPGIFPGDTCHVFITLEPTGMRRIKIEGK